ncbi:transcriptional repressor [Acholeplasma sp. OttesenSCG-928-E16]|nr:transcriptional repressor [Acholeplasma sp. OttesenSCG-928-E16]
MQKRNTIQKQVILDYINHSKNHPTAEEVYFEIVKKIPNISKATVFRNLLTMANENQIKKIDLANKAVRYDKYDNHYHATCISCKELFDLDLEYRSDLDKVEIGHEILGHDVIYKVICKNCKGESKK